MTDELRDHPASKDLKILSRRRVYDGFCTVDEIDIEYTRRDGARRRISRELHHHGNAVAVLPVDRERKTVLLVRQLRVSALIEHGCGFPLEACAGLIDPGEDPATAAAREMEEELGFRPRDLRFLCSVFSSPGILGEKMDLFLSDYSEADLTGPGGGLVDEDEDIEIVEMPCRKLARLMREGGLPDAKTVILTQHLMIETPDLFA